METVATPARARRAARAARAAAARAAVLGALAALVAPAVGPGRGPAAPASGRQAGTGGELPVARSPAPGAADCAAGAGGAAGDSPAAVPEPDPDLYCIELLPTGRAPEAGGAVRLRRFPSPFGTSVTAEGVHRWDLATALRGLPDPSSLGPYRAYVAWATTPLLNPVVRLGPVGNGPAHLGPLALDSFLILVSAEPSERAAERTGPLVLRGSSAGARLRPHDLGRVLAAMGPRQGAGERVGGLTSRGPAHAPDPAAHAPKPGTHARDFPPREVGPDGAGGPGAGEWPAFPMHPGIGMPPRLMALRPDVSPFLPAAPRDGAPPARAAQVVDLADGDTLELVAAPVLRTIAGRTHLMYAFNGSHPGPLVRVRRGATVVVTFWNRTELATAVHWHGVRLENRFDGVPGVTQEAVPPGGSFTYRVTFPDAGLYWYHPHHREDVLQDLGLYGNLRVDDPSAPPARVHREEVLLLDDLLVGEEGLVPWGRERATHALMGRFGNVLLVNGEPRWDLAVERGSVVRFWLTNASNARTWNLSFSGAPMKVAAADLGPLEREERVESVVLAPAERWAVDVLFPEAGSYALVNRVRALDGFAGRFLPRADTLGVVRVAERPATPDLRPAFEALRTDSAAVAEIDRYREAFARPVDRELVLTLEAEGLPFPIGPLLALESAYANPVEWSGAMPEMNGAATGRALRWVLRDASTGAENEAIDWRLRAGDLVKLRLTGDRGALHPMQHPIHIHGQRFLVLAQGGTPRRNLAWKDTVLLAAGDKADLLLEASNPGRWMLHCHVAEHLESGMSMVLEVEP